MHSDECAKENATGGSAPSRNPDILQPLAMPLARAVTWSGLSRSTLYRMAAEGRVRLVKCGRSTLVDASSLRALVAALPPAAVRTGAKVGTA